MPSPARLASACALLAATFALLAATFALVPAGASAAPLSIRIEGNHFVNGAGQTIRLLGVNHPSPEYACVDGYGYDDGHLDDADAAAIASWNANAVRVPLNEDCWLGINGQPNSSMGAEPPLTMAGYRQEIESYVASLNAHGLYAILDLHWTAPGNQVALEQQPMPDYDHSPDFWQSVASTFKDDPAVVFDVFNEPYDPTDPRSGDDLNPSDKVTWNCWDTGTEEGPAGGAPCFTQAYNENDAPTSRYRVAGLQTLVDTIRTAGAPQPVLTGGLNFSNDLSQWATHAPDDPLDQEAASFHNYPGQACDNVSCWDEQIAPLAANVPVVTGEFDQDVSPCAASNFDNEYMSWADQHGVSYLAWGWLVLSQTDIEHEGCSAYYLITDYSGTPAPPNGTNLHDHLATLPPGGVMQAKGPEAGGAKAPIKLTGFHANVLPGGAKVAFVLRAAESCSGVLSGRAKPHKLSLGKARFRLVAGKSKTVVLKLPKAAKRLLAAKRSLKALFTVTLSSPADATTVLHRGLTLKAAAKKR